MKIKRKWYDDWRERLAHNLSGPSAKPWKPLYVGPRDEAAQERRLMDAANRRASRLVQQATVPAFMLLEPIDEPELDGLIT